MEEEKKLVILKDPNEEKELFLKDTLPNICNTIIKSGTKYHKITLGDEWGSDASGITTPWKGDDFVIISRTIINTPSLTHLQLYPLSPSFIITFSYLIIIINTITVGASLWLNQITHLKTLSLDGK